MRIKRPHPFIVLLVVIFPLRQDNVHAICISLQGSSACSEFQHSSIDTTLSNYAFLEQVRDAGDFDIALQKYIDKDFAVLKYLDQYHCPAFQPDSPVKYYARFTTTILCAAIVQKSGSRCSLNGIAAETVCATTCASYAESQASIISSAVCGLSLTSEVMNQIRQDYNLCTIPVSAYAHSACVNGSRNEPTQCGLTGNTEQLCNLCQSERAAGTEECCQSLHSLNCTDVLVSKPPVVSFVPSAQAPTSDRQHSMSGGQIGAIVTCVMGIAVGVSLFIILHCRKRKKAKSLRHRMHTLNSIRSNVEIVDRRTEEFASAYRETSSSEQTSSAFLHDRSPGVAHSYSSSSIEFGMSKEDSSIETDRATAAKFCTTTRRQQGRACLSDSSLATNSNIPISPLPSFKDQYTGTVLQVGSIVTCVHEYEPILSDELLARPGDQIRIVEIYDDSWCRGVVLNSVDTEPKAFPAVCVRASGNVYNSTTTNTTSRGCQSLPPLVEESRPALLTRNSASRFKEHVGSALDVE